LPFEALAARRHRIPEQKHRVTDWAEYDAGLRARGSLTVRFTPEAIAAWRAGPRTGRGGQPRYSALGSTRHPSPRAHIRTVLRAAGMASVAMVAALHAAGAAPGMPKEANRQHTGPIRGRPRWQAVPWTRTVRAVSAGAPGSVLLGMSYPASFAKVCPLLDGLALRAQSTWSLIAVRPQGLPRSSTTVRQGGAMRRLARQRAPGRDESGPTHPVANDAFFHVGPPTGLT
jgi:hypothetical protein